MICYACCCLFSRMFHFSEEMPHHPQRKHSVPTGFSLCLITDSPHRWTTAKTPPILKCDFWDYYPVLSHKGQENWATFIFFIQKFCKLLICNVTSFTKCLYFFLNCDIWLYLVLGLSVLMVPKLFWRQFGGRAPAAPSLPLAGFSLREKQIPGGGRALSMHGNPMSRTHPVPAPGGSSGLAHSQEHLAHLCCQIHATRKTNMDTVYHLKVNLVHVKGAGNTTQTIHNIHFPTQ